MIKAGIVGATGYTGSELVRILNAHPDVSIEAISSESYAGKKFSEIHSQMLGIADLELVRLSELANMTLDIVFLALPHGVSMDFVKDFSNRPYKIIDLSGDFRFKDKAVYEAWYQQKHCCPEKMTEAVYGLPELYRETIIKAKLVAAPGCYPTSAILPLAPLIKEGIIDQNSIVIDSKSGATGAGVKPKAGTHFPSLNDNFNAYGVKTHRHTPEIEESLSDYTGFQTKVQFTPHLLPVNRGILTCTYSMASTKIDNDGLKKAYEKHYGNEHFVRLREQPPSLHDIKGSNYCDIFSTVDERIGRVITISCIDNLVKGAAGQAVQSMNLLCGIEETKGLLHVPLTP